MGKATRSKSILHDGEADQHHDQHEAADESGRDKVILQPSGDREGRRANPHEQQEPCGDQHHRPVDAMYRQIEDQNETHSRHGRQ